MLIANYLHLRIRNEVHVPLDLYFARARLKGKLFRQAFSAQAGGAVGGCLVFQPRDSDLDNELSKHLVVRLTNAVTSMDLCVVHLRRPIGQDGMEKQTAQNRALLKWSMRHLSVQFFCIRHRSPPWDRTGPPAP